jgi:hypothetical protein
VVLKRHRSLESDDAAKVARHVREGAVGKGPRSGQHLDNSGQVGAYVGTSLAVYFMSQESRPAKKIGKANRRAKGQPEKSGQRTPLTKVSRGGVIELSVERGA